MPPSKATLSERAQQILKGIEVMPAPHSVGKAFRSYEPAIDLFPVDLWARVASRVLRRAPRSLYGHGNAGGYQPLRRAIAELAELRRRLDGMSRAETAAPPQPEPIPHPEPVIVVSVPEPVPVIIVPISEPQPQPIAAFAAEQIPEPEPEPSPVLMAKSLSKKNASRGRRMASSPGTTA